VEAGRMGLSMNIVVQMGGILLAWMTTKASPFGQLIARNEIAELDRLFFRSLLQSLGLFCLAGITALTGVILLNHFAPALSRRIVSWPIFLLLLLTALGSHVVQSLAIYLRAHKCEPFFLQSILIAFTSALGVVLVARPGGALGISIVYFLVLGVSGVISATIIFQAKRSQWAQSGVPI
jgi:hypothetical protein